MYVSVCIWHNQIGNLFIKELDCCAADFWDGFWLLCVFLHIHYLQFATIKQVHVRTYVIWYCWMDRVHWDSRYKSDLLNSIWPIFIFITLINRDAIVCLKQEVSQLITYLFILVLNGYEVSLIVISFSFTNVFSLDLPVLEPSQFWAAVLIVGECIHILTVQVLVIVN